MAKSTSVADIVKETEADTLSASALVVKKLEPAKTKVGDIVQVISYVKVLGKGNAGAGRDYLSVEAIDETDHNSFEIRGTDLVEKLRSADQFHEIREVTRTEIVRHLMKSYNTPFTVCFEKKEDKKDPTADRERVLRGFLIEPIHEDGRSMCLDLDLPDNDSGKRIREVDHRTLKWMIEGFVLYIDKKIPKSKRPSFAK